MLRIGFTHTRLVVVLGTAFALAACKKSENYGSDTGMAKDTTAAARADTGMAPAPAAPAALSDPNIVYILDNANMLDSAAGSIAATKGTAADVRDFGKRMMRDHHALRKQGQDLAKKLNVTPEAPANDDSKAQYDKFGAEQIERQQSGHQQQHQQAYKSGEDDNMQPLRGPVFAGRRGV